MKQICSILIFLGLLLNTKAQQIRWGVKGSIGEGQILLKLKQNNQVGSLPLEKTSFSIGGLAEYKFSDDLFIQPQLYFITKGGRINMSGSLEFKLTQFELPVYLLYRYNGFSLGAGPSLSYGLKAQGVSTGTMDDNLYKDTSTQLLPGVKFKRFEAGVSALMGYEFPSGFFLQVNYTKGFNISSKPTLAEIRNRVFGISIGHFIRTKKK